MKPPLPLRALILALLAAATLAAFAGVRGNGWILLDDPLYVTGNPQVAHGLTPTGARWFLHEPHAANWHPLTSWSHMLDVTLFGLDPAGPHVVNLLLHVLNAVLVAWVLFALTGAWWRSVLVAGLFALHPLRVESVAWISERKDVLSGAFFLLALGAWRGWVARPSRPRYATVALLLALGLMSKPMLVTLPAVLVLLDIWPLGRLRGGPPPAVPAPAGAAPQRSLAGLIGEKWPLWALAAAGAIVTVVVQSRAEATATMDVLSFARRAGNAALAYWRYVGTSLWPAHLSVFYPYDRVLGVGRVAVAAVALVAVTVAALAQLRRRPWLAVGWLWFLGMLLPVLGLLQVGGQAYADRYTYLPALGLAIVLVWGVGELVARSKSARVAAAVLALVVLAALGIATTRQVALWKDTPTLFTHALAEVGDNLVGARLAHRFLGYALVEAGQTPLAIPHLEESLGLPLGREAALRDTLRLRPADVETRRELATILARENRVEEAIGEYRAILAQAPGDLDALVNIAWIRSTHMDARHRDGSEAARMAERAMVRSPEPMAVIEATLAAAYAEAGRLPEAVRAGERAVALARAAGERDEAERYARQLAFYRRGQPFHYAD